MNRERLSNFLDFRDLIMVQLRATEPAELNILPMLLKLKKQVENSIFAVTMGVGRNACVSRQLQQLQKELILLSNELFIQGEKGYPSEFCSLAQGSVIGILEHLKNHNTTCFDGNQTIPLYLAEESKKVLTDKIPLLQAAMKSRKINTALQEAVLHPFLNFDTYMQMHYVLKHIDKFISHLREKGDDESLLYLLLCYGCNSPSFNRYYMQRVTEMVRTNESIKRQLEALYDYDRMLRGLPRKTQVCYDCRIPSSKVIVRKFIKAEIEFLLNKQQINTPIVKLATQQHSHKIDYRLKTSLSVDGLAYLLRLLVETEVIQANPKSELIAFMAAHVQTCGNGEQALSAHSLGTKYKQVTQFTASRVRSVLVKMAKHAEDSFNL